MRLAVGLGVAAWATMVGSSSGEYHTTTNTAPSTKAMTDPMAANGTRRRHQVGLPLGPASDRPACAGREAVDGTEGVPSARSRDASLEAAHSCAACARRSSGATSSARSTYARLARGSSLSHAIQSSAARLDGSRRSTLRKARRASFLSPDRAAASPLLSSASVLRSMRIALDQHIVVHRSDDGIVSPFGSAQEDETPVSDVPTPTEGDSQLHRVEFSTAPARCQLAATARPEGRPK